ncbi:NPC intracellular cholesterol transporter 2 homolog a [Cephus cinctus]|uniref:NPC intracellular cholesterol transporter 2 homolog a n=1 Tax=Cephus cinctus TaxID=211228 RepID=A0AAJ7BG45_CEPCN|nr:NPC intracellular cholesterol transporter 2 homolog a [Cephus cinctus]
MLRETFLVLATLLVLAAATQVNHCGNGKLYEDPNQVQITGCNSPPCKLKKRTKIGIEQKFVPNRDVQTLTTSVHATILGIPLPFVGVDGANACQNIFNADGSKSSCPLKKGTPYIYKNEFPILELYPKVSLVVYYALTEKNDIVTCFEVPSKITS